MRDILKVKNLNGLTDEEVLLKNCGGSSGQSKIRHFDNSTCDILFIVVVNGDMYEIPSSEITVKSTLTLTDKWDKYKVSL